MAKIEKVEIRKDKNGNAASASIIYDDRKFRNYPADRIPGTAKEFMKKANKVSERKDYYGEEYTVYEIE